MKPFIKKRYEPVAFGLLLSGMMSFFVTGISTAVALGVIHPEFLASWMSSWAIGWAVAFPVVLFVAPLVRKIINKLTIQN